MTSISTSDTLRNATPDDGAHLPDPALSQHPVRPFQSDPGRSETWWWLFLPAGLTVFLVTCYALAPEWYKEHVLPEGYGILELGHFFIPLVGFLIAIRLLFRPFVRQRRLVLVFVGVAALACFYIAGEEHSWGQHFFRWETPEAWSKLNRQDETNLHNVIDVFDKNPRLLLELGVFLGGLGIPLAAVFIPWIRRNRWSLFLPAAAMVPVALGALLFKASSILQNVAGTPALVFRPSEATETFLYLFILFYLIVFVRRIRELEATNG
ncbi:MAG: hypothetical protein ACR2PO_06305 [Methyloligellaceae bacterium]